MKKGILYILTVACMFAFTACSVQKDDTEKVKDIDFTVMDPRDIPEDLQEEIEQKKENAFELTYGEDGYLYIAKGYGAQDTSGCSVEVNECYESTNAVCVKTSLLGPEKDEETVDQTTYPYVVIKIEYREESVIFK